MLLYFDLVKKCVMLLLFRRRLDKHRINCQLVKHDINSSTQYITSLTILAFVSAVCLGGVRGNLDLFADGGLGTSWLSPSTEPFI